MHISLPEPLSSWILSFSPFRDVLQATKTGFTQMMSLAPTLEEITDLFRSPGSQSPPSFISSIAFIQDSIASTCTQFSQWEQALGHLQATSGTNSAPERASEMEVAGAEVGVASAEGGVTGTEVGVASAEGGVTGTEVGVASAEVGVAKALENLVTKALLAVQMLVKSNTKEGEKEQEKEQNNDEDGKNNLALKSL